MKTIIALALALAGMAAQAFDFYPASNYSCGTYCTGYFSSDPNHVVDCVNLQYAGVTLGYKVVISLDGVVYAGYESAPTDGGVLYASDGTFITLSNVTSTYKHTCTHSGRGQHCTSWYWIVSGTVTQ